MLLNMVCKMYRVVWKFDYGNVCNVFWKGKCVETLVLVTTQTQNVNATLWIKSTPFSIKTNNINWVNII